MTNVTLYNFIEVNGEEWAVHLWGDLEEYEDGTRQVVDIEARITPPKGEEFLYCDCGECQDLPEEVSQLTEALLDDHKTSNNMLEHGAIHR